MRLASLLTTLFLSACGAGSFNDFSSRLAQAPAEKAAAQGTLGEVTAPLGRKSLAASSGSTELSPVTENQFFEWAEATFAHLFPAGGSTQTLQTYRYRYYPQTDLYLAIEGSRHVVAIGQITNWALVALGTLEDFRAPVHANFRASIARTDQIAEAVGTLDSNDYKAWNWDAIKVNANRNIALCDPGYWSGALTDEGMTQDSTIWPQTLAISGTDLTNFSANNRGANARLYREINRLAFSSNPERLTRVLQLLIEQQSFTLLADHRFLTWRGTEPKWLLSYPLHAETGWRAGQTLVAVSLAYTALKSTATPDFLQSVVTYGDKLAEAMVGADDGIEFDDPASITGGADRASRMTLALVSWGLATQNRAYLSQGITLLVTLLDHLDAQSRLPKFMTGHSGVELVYISETLQTLTFAAHLLMQSGIDVFPVKNANGGALLDGIEWTLTRYFDPISRLDIPTTQNENSLSRARFASDGSISYAEIVYAYPGLSEAQRNIARTALAVREKSTEPNTLQGYGFYELSAPGYSSCFFSTNPGSASFIPANRSAWLRFIETRDPADLDTVDY